MSVHACINEVSQKDPDANFLWSTVFVQSKSVGDEKIYIFPFFFSYLEMSLLICWAAIKSELNKTPKFIVLQPTCIDSTNNLMLNSCK